LSSTGHLFFLVNIFLFQEPIFLPKSTNFSFLHQPAFETFKKHKLFSAGKNYSRGDFMSKILALLLLLLLAGTTAYVIYIGVVLPILNPFLKNKP